MPRKLARIAKVDRLSPIPKADLLEAAHVGGWVCVVKKGVFQPGDLGVYFEIDSFLPEGEPAWQFLVDKSPREFVGRVGHALHTMTLRGRLSQGLLLPLRELAHRRVGATEMPFHLAPWAVGQDVTEALGVLKYEKPLPPELQEIALGYLPSGVPETDQERIQNLSEELALWRARPDETWETTEKLEGESCTFALLERQLHACSRKVDFKDLPQSPHWQLAHKLEIGARLRAVFGDRPIALRGELVGPGVEGNIYHLPELSFYLYDIYDVQAGSTMAPTMRRELAKELGVPHVPVLQTHQALEPASSVEALLQDADGSSQLRPTQRREGKVYKANHSPASFKAISNAYLLGTKL